MTDPTSRFYQQIFMEESMTPYQITGEDKAEDNCQCGIKLQQAIINHDPVLGNTAGWECPNCREQCLKDRVAKVQD